MHTHAGRVRFVHIWFSYVLRRSFEVASAPWVFVFIRARASSTRALLTLLRHRAARESQHHGKA